MEFEKYTLPNGTSIDVLEIVAVAERATDAILEIYKKDSADWGVEYKEGDQGPLTLADKASNEIICEALKAISPGVPIVSEESDQIPWEVRRTFEHFWSVDPLDGTKEFIKRNGQFTVNIALCSGNRPVLGVVTVPVQQTAYFGVHGQGAFKRESRSDEFKRINAAEFSMDQSGLTIIGSRSHNTPTTTEYLAKFKDPKFLTMGSSLKLLLVAEGAAHVYPRLAPTCEWDTCAAHAVVNEAGGRVEQLEGGCAAEAGKEVVYNKMDLLNPFFVVFGRCEA